MGLTVTVGILADLLVRGKEGAASVERELMAVNTALKAAGYRRHKEPTKCEVWSARVYGHSGLHALREVAGQLASNEPLRRDKAITGQDTPAAERHFADILERVLGAPVPGLLGRLFGGAEPKLPKYAHIAFHSDAHGYYVPVNFGVPLFPSEMEDGTKHIWPLGSSHKLLDETTRVARALEIPNGMRYDDTELRRWLEGPDDPPEALWQIHNIAAYSCLLLQEAAKLSIAKKAAIHFG
jgi:hypothetical protein